MYYCQRQKRREVISIHVVLYHLIRGALHHQSKSVKERDSATGIWIKRHPLLPHLEPHLLN